MQHQDLGLYRTSSVADGCESEQVTQINELLRLSLASQGAHQFQNRSQPQVNAQQDLKPTSPQQPLVYLVGVEEEQPQLGTHQQATTIAQNRTQHRRLHQLHPLTGGHHNQHHLTSHRPRSSSVSANAGLSNSISPSDALSLGINLEQYISKRNERERSRVRNVNDAFDNLKNSLPLDVDRLTKRMSKVEILRTAISYIRDLKDVLGDHEDTFRPRRSSDASLVAANVQSQFARQQQQQQHQQQQQLKYDQHRAKLERFGGSRVLSMSQQQQYDHHRSAEEISCALSQPLSPAATTTLLPSAARRRQQHRDSPVIQQQQQQQQSVGVACENCSYLHLSAEHRSSCGETPVNLPELMDVDLCNPSDSFDVRYSANQHQHQHRSPARDQNQNQSIAKVNAPAAPQPQLFTGLSTTNYHNNHQPQQQISHQHSDGCCRLQRDESNLGGLDYQPQMQQHLQHTFDYAHQYVNY